MLALLATVGWSDDRPPAVTWDPAADSQRLRVHAPADRVVTVRFRALLGSLEYAWSQGPYVASGGALSVDVRVPSAAWLDPAARDFVTDLVVTVEIGARRLRAPEAYLAWPAGPGAPAVVWTRAEQRRFAPHGVFAASAIRLGLSSDDPEERFLPHLASPEPAEAR
jgi:hypothetical protein